MKLFEYLTPCLHLELLTCLELFAHSELSASLQLLNYIEHFAKFAFLLFLTTITYSELISLRALSI